MDDLEKESLRRDRDALEAALKEAGCDFIRGSTARCPFHDDQHPSGSIHLRKEGVWAFRCHPCNLNEDVIGLQARARNAKCGDVLRGAGKGAVVRKSAPSHPAKHYPSVDAIRASYGGNADDLYAYTNPDTKAVELVVVRVVQGDRKVFHQFRPVSTGGFESGAPPKPWPLFNRGRIRGATEVWVVEGEKCVKALHAVGAVATTSPCGAGKAQYADWTPLSGKTVFLWPDSDPADPKTGIRTGIAHMEAVALELAKLEPAPMVLWVNPDELDLPEKGDAADYLEPFEGDVEECQRALLAVQSIATMTGPAEELSKMMEDTISGRRRAIEWPYPSLSRLSRALFPGTVTAICGDPGCGKSFLALECAAYWFSKGVKVALYELEDDRAYHLSRVLAQLDGCSDLADDEWLRGHPEEARKAMDRHRDVIGRFGACVHTRPDGDTTLDELLEWIRERCVAKCRIVIIDPVTAAESGDKPWIADRKFIMAAKAIVRAHGASLILVTHPKLGLKPGGGSPLHGMAGGAAYPRFSHSVFWMVKHPEPIRVQIKGIHGMFKTTIDRSLRIGKARNGVGTNVELGFVFDPKNLRFAEQGAVQKKLKGAEADDDEPTAEDL